MIYVFVFEGGPLDGVKMPSPVCFESIDLVPGEGLPKLTYTCDWCSDDDELVVLEGRTLPRGGARLLTFVLSEPGRDPLADEATLDGDSGLV